MRNHYIFSTLTALLCLFCFSVSAQQTTREYMLLLQSGIVRTEANLRHFDRSSLATEIVNGYYYRIVQFYEIPSTEQKESLANNGIILMDYLPEFAFMAAIPVNTDVEILKNSKVRNLVEFSADMKIKAGLLENIPDWAKRNSNKVELDVKIHSNINLNFAAGLLKNKGYEVNGTSKFGNRVGVVIDENNIVELAELPFVYFVDAISAPPTPDDARARSLHRVNGIQNEYLGGRNYTGAGVTVAIADDGAIGPHIDFTGRVTQFLTNSGGTHGDMTAGIMVGAGNLNPRYKGSAPGAHINMYTINGYNHIVDAVNHYNNLNTVITSTSYTQGSGGVYTTDAQAIDQQIRENPQLMHVFSAGNAGSGWNTITGGYKAAKSVIACGNLNGFDVLENSSSRGPTQDGRIKPDLCANGFDQMSTDPDNTYSPGGGTSAASPSVAAVVTCLYEAYKSLNGGVNPPSALIKASMLNSAEDLGNPGPDFQHGWGRVNAFRALTTLEDNRYLSSSVSQGDSNLHILNVPAGVSELRVMVYWPDYEGSPAASKALVNDLNIVLSTPGGTDYEPWVLNPTPGNYNAVAIRATDTLNAVEQVTLDNPAPGSYSLKVKGFSIPQGPQEYYLVYEFRTDSIIVSYPTGGEGFVPGEQEHIRWEAYGNSGPFTIEYTADNGSSWNAVTTNVNGNLRSYTWTVPTNITAEAKVRISRGSVTGESDQTFSIVGLPSGISFVYACPDSVQLSWTGVNGATGYEISRLGTMYMDSIGHSVTTMATVAGANPLNESWYSVRAIMINGNKGRRANAVYKAPGLFNCVLAYDAEVELVNPLGGIVFDCQNITAQPVSINLTNEGSNPISNIPVYFSVNAGTPVSELYTGTLSPGASFVYTFTNTLDLTIPDTLSLVTWSEYPGDNNIYNDTAKTKIIILNGLVINLPWVEDFESFGLCSTDNDCEAIVCNLANGFLNQPNNEIDNIDWRTNNGPTLSSGTGPANDHTTGTGSGKYLYLEASACFQREAQLSTPCIDLTTATLPLLTFWYHMNGSDMGSLHLDVVSNGTWTLNAMPPISGNQGNSWKQASVNLSAFAGNIITVRFRGLTGNDYQSDIAIDDINVLEVNSAPVVSFIADKTSACQGQTINLTDLSSNVPSQWQWNITPSTFIYVNGTTVNSQHPQIQFTATGIYDITLVATNSFGSDSATQSAYINITSGAALPLMQNFESTGYPPLDWSVISAGGNYTWEQSASIIGADGLYTYASYMNNFSYNNPGAEDALVTPLINSSGVNNAVLTFDVSYARYNGSYSDTLRIDISTDCGSTYLPTGYLKGGTTLATVPDQTNIFTPSSASQWRKDTVLLSALTNGEIFIKFVNINRYGNSLFIDNVNIDFATSAENNLVLNPGVIVYPNPATESFSMDLINLQGELKLEVIDPKGRIVIAETIHNSSSKISKHFNLQNSSPGIYFIKINSESGTINKKLIVY